MKLNNATIGALRTQFFFYLSAYLASYKKKITASTEKNPCLENWRLKLESHRVTKKKICNEKFGYHRSPFPLIRAPDAVKQHLSSFAHLACTARLRCPWGMFFSKKSTYIWFNAKLLIHFGSQYKCYCELCRLFSILCKQGTM